VKYQQITTFVRGKQFLECRVAGGLEGPSSRGADTLRNLNYAVNLG
jgi:hypothetical protein